MPITVSPQFIDDLKVVLAYIDAGGLRAEFLQDLKIACAHARPAPKCEISMADLNSIAERLHEWRINRQRALKNMLDNLHKDDPLISKVSLFGTMDYGRLETAHTRTLAWLLDKKEHGFGHRLLEALLRSLMNDNSLHITDLQEIKSEHWTNNGRIDVFAKGRWKVQNTSEDKSWVLAIEAKIDANKSDDQLSRYDEWLNSHHSDTELLRVFLTQDARASKTHTNNWQPLSFSKMAGIFWHVSGLQDCQGYHFLRYYLTGVLREICDTQNPMESIDTDPYTAINYLRAQGITERQKEGDNHD